MGEVHTSLTDRMASWRGRDSLSDVLFYLEEV